MPLIISEKNITWCETTDIIKIIVPFQSRIDARTSVLITTKYLKISSPPWLWEGFLASSINTHTSHAVIEENLVSFELKKKVPGLWNNLEDGNRGKEAFRKEVRDQAFEENKKRLEEIEATNSAKKAEIRKASVRKQMQLNEKESELIEYQKRAESERMAAELERLRKHQQRANDIALKRKKLQELLSSKPLPPPRKCGHITVSFTPREFPTAARESQEAEEKEWLEKQTAAARSLKLEYEDLSSEEKNPDWLKKKAESLYKKEEYRGAENAYSLAIRLCPNMYSLYLGRSACHLRLRNLHKCVEDSSKALDLLAPPVPSNASDRLESHKIRGTAFQQLDLPIPGLMDFEAALKLNPKDEESKTNAEILRKLIQNEDI